MAGLFWLTELEHGVPKSQFKQDDRCGCSAIEVKEERDNFKNKQKEVQTGREITLTNTA